MSQDNNKANVPAIPDPGWAEAILQSGKIIMDVIGSIVPIVGPLASQLIGANLEERHDQRVINACRSVIEDRINSFRDLLAVYQKNIPHEIITNNILHRFHLLWVSKLFPIEFHSSNFH